ncbi:MAG: glycosyltransferase, partial [Cytophagales bacterium]
LVAIENKNESQVAQIMKESTFYLSFGYPEGLPLPPAEAMACGCVVIGYNGGGGEEYFDPAYCLPVPFGNIIEFVEKVEEACLDIQKNEEKYLQMSKRASETIHSRYSAQNEKEILLNTWKKILSS